MTEFLETKPDVADAHWAETAGETTEQPVALQDRGYHTPTGAEAGDIPTAAHLNWLLREFFRWCRNLSGGAVRRFVTLAEGISACEPGELFTVYRPGPIGDTVVSHTPAKAPTCWCHDGRYLVYGIDKTGTSPRVSTIKAYHAGSGVQLGTGAWTAEDCPHSVCSDGRYVFVASVSGAGPYETTIEMFDLDALTPWDDVDTYTIALDWNPVINGLAANGTHLVAIGNNATDDKSQMTVISYDADGMALVGAASLCDSTGMVKAVAIADRWAVMVGAQNPASPESNALTVVQLSDATELVTLNVAAWSKATDFGWLAVSTDGQRILVTGYAMDPAAGTDHRAVMWLVPDPGAGWMAGFTILTQEDFGNTFNAPCSVDDSLRLIAETSAGVIEIADKRETTIHVTSATGDTGTAPTCTVRESLDGMCYWIWDGSQFKGVQIHQEPRLFRRVAANDPYREPLPGRLAQPVR